MPRRIVAVMGSYRRHGFVDTAVDAILDGVRTGGADTEKIALVDRHVEFCLNCRACTLQPGSARGTCVHHDDVPDILDEIERSDALVLAAPTNFFNLNALTRRFMERLVCYSHWPWNEHSPRMRIREKTKNAVIVTSAAMPGILIPLSTGSMRALRIMAGTLGARVVGSLKLGLSNAEHARLSSRTLRKAEALGKMLALAPN